MGFLEQGWISFRGFVVVSFLEQGCPSFFLGFVGVGFLEEEWPSLVKLVSSATWVNTAKYLSWFIPVVFEVQLGLQFTVRTQLVYFEIW